MLDILLVFTSCVVLLGGVFRHTSLIREPSCPIKTPFGKLPFFDGVILYGLFIIVGVFTVKAISSIL